MNVNEMSDDKKKLILDVFETINGRAIDAFDWTGIKYKININKWFDMKKKKVEGLAKKAVSFLGSDNKMRDITLDQVNIWFHKEPNRRSFTEYGYIIANGSQNAINIINKELCEKVGMPQIIDYWNKMAYNSDEDAFTVIAMTDIFDMYDEWLRNTNKTPNNNLVRIFEANTRGGIAAFDKNGERFTINLKRWLELCNYEVRDVSQILHLSVAPVGSNSTVKDVKIGDLYLWYYGPVSRPTDFGLVIAKDMDEAMELMHTQWICDNAGFPDLPKYSSTRCITIHTLASIYNLYIWWTVSPEGAAKPRTMQAMNSSGEYIIFVTDPDCGDGPLMNMNMVWMYSLYPILDINNVGFVVAENINEAWEIIQKFDLYRKAGGEWIGVSGTEYVSPAHYMMLTNLGTKEKYGNFGDRFVPIYEVFEQGKAEYVEDTTEEKQEENQELLALYRWHITRNGGTEVKVGVAIYSAYDPDGLLKLIQAKYPHDGSCQAEYKVKELMRLPGFTGIESMVCDLIDYGHKVHLCD